MKKRMICVIGLGRFGRAVATTLVGLGHEVLGIDCKESLVEDLKDRITHAVVADVREEKVLEALGLRNFDAAVVAIGDDIQASILVTLMLKEMGVPWVVAKAVNEIHGKVLEKVGADKLIFPEREMGEKLAHYLDSRNVLNYIELSDDYTIMEVEATKKLQGKTLKDTDLRSRYGINVLAVRRNHGIIVSPDGDFVMTAGDVLIVLGETDKVEHFSHVL